MGEGADGGLPRHRGFGRLHPAKRLEPCSSLGKGRTQERLGLECREARDDVTAEALRLKHPLGPDVVAPQLPDGQPQPFSAAEVRKALMSLSHSASGPSGLAPDIVRSLACACPLLWQLLADVLGLLLSPSLPPAPRAFLFGARLVALLKKDGGYGRSPVARSCGAWRIVLRRDVHNSKEKIIREGSKETRNFLVCQRAMAVLLP